MAKTLADLQLSLAYRLGEDSAPSDANEKARRTHFINEGYQAVMRKHFWWFSETTDEFNSVASQEKYVFGVAGVPSDVRAILELRYQDRLYSQVGQPESMKSITLPYNNMSEVYFVFGNAIYPMPTFATSITDGVSLKYYKTATNLTADTDPIIIPDMFSDILVAYAYARVSLIDSERGSASDGFDEFNEILSQMTEEQNKYLFSLKASEDTIELSSIFY